MRMIKDRRFDFCLCLFICLSQVVSAFLLCHFHFQELYRTFNDGGVTSVLTKQTAVNKWFLFHCLSEWVKNLWHFCLSLRRIENPNLLPSPTRSDCKSAVEMFSSHAGTSFYITRADVQILMLWAQIKFLFLFRWKMWALKVFQYQWHSKWPVKQHTWG